MPSGSGALGGACEGLEARALAHAETLPSAQPEAVILTGAALLQSIDAVCP